MPTSDDTEPVIIPAVDMLGKALRVGDLFAYALTIGRSANMGVYRVVELVATLQFGGHRDPGSDEWHHGPHTLIKVRAQQLRVSYGSLNVKPVVLGMVQERALRLPKGFAL